MPFHYQTEDEAQEIVCQWLDMHKVDYFHVPNGGKRSEAEAAKFKRLGVKPGVADLVIMTPTKHGHSGAWLEMKAEKEGRVSKDQTKWLKIADAYGWATKVAHGSNDAIDWLEEMGYKSW